MIAGWINTLTQKHVQLTRLRNKSSDLIYVFGLDYFLLDLKHNSLGASLL